MLWRHVCANFLVIGRQEQLDQVSEINVIPLESEVDLGGFNILSVYINHCTFTIKSLKPAPFVHIANSLLICPPPAGSFLRSAINAAATTVFVNLNKIEKIKKKQPGPRYST